MKLWARETVEHGDFTKHFRNNFAKDVRIVRGRGVNLGVHIHVDMTYEVSDVWLVSDSAMKSYI